MFGVARVAQNASSHLFIWRRLRKFPKSSSHLRPRLFHSNKPLPLSTHLSHLPPADERSDPGAWLKATESFLPSAAVLNSPEKQSLSSYEPSPALDVLSFLIHARDVNGVDVLYELGVHGGHWTAVLWIVRRILQVSDSQPTEHFYAQQAQTSLESPSLDSLTRFAISAKAPHSKAAQYSLGLDQLSARSTPLDPRRPRETSLGQVWQSLGHMILEAADCPVERSEDIMSHVLQIIAHLHHINALPPNFYSYTEPVDGTTHYRPPTLHFLSSRILTSLSDAVWRAQEEAVTAETPAVGAQKPSFGYELPGVRHRVKVRGLGPEVWMELVLWACVEGGMITEATAILKGLKTRVLPESRWTTVDWQNVQNAPLSGGPRIPRITWDRSELMSRGALAAVEGYRTDHPMAQLGSRTISSEVVTAVIDGLLDRLSVRDSDNTLSSRGILDLVAEMQGLLLRDGRRYDAESRKQLMSRMMNSLGPQTQSDPQLLQSIIDIIMMNGPSTDLTEMYPRTPSEFAAILDPLYTLLHQYADSGDLSRACRIYQRLKDIREPEHPSTAAQSESVTHHHDEKGIEIANTHETSHENSDLEHLSPIRTSALASFLDLIIQNEAFPLGAELTCLTDSKSPMVPEELYSEECLIPPLLRLAGTTKDDLLLAKLEDIVTLPLSVDNLRGYLHCMVEMRRWDAVKTLLMRLEGIDGTSWDTELVFRLAALILKDERGPTSEDMTGTQEYEPEESPVSAKDILIGLLRGDYGNPETERLLLAGARDNYIRCICYLLQDASEEILSLVRDSVTTRQRLKTTDMIPVRAFNVLLKAVVHTRGNMAGWTMWVRWCQAITGPASRGLFNANASLFIKDTPEIAWVSNKANSTINPSSSRLQKPRWSQRTRSPEESPATSDDEDEASGRSLGPAVPVVVPNLTTLRIILHGILPSAEKNNSAQPSQGIPETTSNNNEPENGHLSALCAWGVEMFRAFGLTDQEIEEELPPGDWIKEKRRQRGFM